MFINVALRKNQTSLVHQSDHKLSQKSNDLNIIFEVAHLLPGYSSGTGKIRNLNNSTESHGNIILNFLYKHSREILRKNKTFTTTHKIY